MYVPLLTGLQGDLVTVPASAATVFSCSVPATLASGLHLELFLSWGLSLAVPFPLPLAVLFKIINELPLVTDTPHLRSCFLSHLSTSHILIHYVFYFSIACFSH